VNETGELDRRTAMSKPFDATMRKLIELEPAAWLRFLHILEGVSAMILGIRGIEESSVYQGIFAKGRAEGRAEEARDALLRLGGKKLGKPSERVQTRLDAIDDLDRLNALLERILDVSSWDELLAVVDPSV
jgi:predicted transposase YdaD